MANVQLQKTINKTAIDQKQSLEIVQTLLHGGLSSLAYLREFFHDKAFIEQFYESGKVHAYADYADGKLPKRQWEVAGPKTKIQILKRGGSKRADMFLDWLVSCACIPTLPPLTSPQEGGVFKALKDGTLHSLEVYVHPDSDDRERVIEQYTFTVTYTPGAQNGQMLAQLEIDSDGHPTVNLGEYLTLSLCESARITSTLYLLPRFHMRCYCRGWDWTILTACLEAASDALTSLLKQIIKVCSALPELPAKRFLTMRLFYTNDTRKPPKLPGWLPSSSDRVFFAECHGWEKRVQKLQALDSGFYSSSLKIDHLQPIGEDAERSKPGYEPPVFPESLHFKQPLQEPDKANIMAPRDRILSIIESLEPSADDEDFEEAQAVKQPANIPQSDDTIYTQASHVPEMIFGLNKMLQPEVLTQGDTQTQAHMHGRLTNQLTKGTQPKLVPHTINRLEANKQTAKVHKSEGHISCQCSYEEDEGQMACCTYCNTWQHLHCYGMSGLLTEPSNPVNASQEHDRYMAVLGPEVPTAKQLND